MSYISDMQLHFYANACALCKKFGNGIKLIKCEYCRMVSYCSDEHRQDNWLEHKEICGAIETVNSQWELYHIGETKPNSTVVWHDWLWTKRKFAILVALKLNRRLTLYELEMFEFPPACILCHSKKELSNCKNCASVSYCSNHAELYKMKHNSEICSLLKQCYFLDLSTQEEPELTYLSILQYERYREVTNMDTFLRIFLLDYMPELKKKEIVSTDLLTLHSELVTRPLTLLFGLGKIHVGLVKRKDLLVHVIASNYMEETTIAGWEILLHLMPNLKTLRIVLIGPQLEEVSYDTVLYKDLCRQCTISHRMLLIEYHTCVYDDYRNSKLFEHPHVIVGFNAHLHAYDKELVGYTDTWKDTIRTIYEEDCPFILSCHTAMDGQKDLHRIKSLSHNQPSPVYADHNPFASLRPYRHTEKETVIYKNAYLIVFERLKHPLKQNNTKQRETYKKLAVSMPRENTDDGQGPSAEGSYAKRSISRVSSGIHESSPLSSDATLSEYSESSRKTSDAKHLSKQGSSDSGTYSKISEVSEVIKVIPEGSAPISPPKEASGEDSGDKDKDGGEGILRKETVPPLEKKSSEESTDEDEHHTGFVFIKGPKVQDC